MTYMLTFGEGWGGTLWQSQFTSRWLFRRAEKSVKKRIEIVEKFDEKRKEVLAREKIPLLNRRKESIMNPWGHRANVAFCTFFFVYQVCSQTYLIVC